MNRIFWRFWNLWSGYVQKSSEFRLKFRLTNRIAVTLVLLLFVFNWLMILLVGKQRLREIAARPIPPWYPRWYPHWLWHPSPAVLLVALLLSVFLTAWSLSPLSRKLKAPYRSAFLAMGLAGVLSAVTQLWLRF